MLIICLGYKTNDLKEVPSVVYLGCDGEEAGEAIEAAKAKFPRIERMNGPSTFRVHSTAGHSGKVIQHKNKPAPPAPAKPAGAAPAKADPSTSKKA